MQPTNGRRNVRKIEVPIGTPTEFQLGDTIVDIQKRGEKREQREGGGRETTEGGEGRGGSQENRNSTVTHRGGSGRKKNKN